VVIPTVVPKSATRISSVRTALVAGFAVVVTLWLIWGIQIVRSLSQVELALAEVQASYQRGEEILDRIRTNVLLGSIHLRDALIDHGARDVSRAESERLRIESSDLLRSYVPQVTSPLERTEWERLRGELDAYWASRNLAFSSGALSAADASRLRSLVVPRREAALLIIDRLATLQAEASRQREREIAALYAMVRRQLVTMGVGTLIAALLVVAVVSRHVGRLERQVERQQLSERQNREDLERLSARLVEAQEQERRSLARELHDAVGQALTAVKMDVGIALRADPSPRVRMALEDAREIMEATLRGVRDLSQLLHPSTLDDFGLPATLTAHLRGFSQRTGIQARLDQNLAERLAPDLEICVYRIVQEAMNNVARHSGATQCTVSVRVVDDTLRLAIQDDGCGLTSLPDTRGLGIIGMRERAQALGGSFAIDGSGGAGTRVNVVLPLRRAAGEPSQDRLAG
jgi:signal transduction histidine kinase